MEQAQSQPAATVTSRPRPELPKARITRREDLTGDLWKVWLEPEVPFTFKPGQYCTIGADSIERAYSIVSAPHEPQIELFIELVPPPDGQLTPLLWNLYAGDTITIRDRAKGIFTFDPKYENHLMVATVTGVVPYISIIRDYIYRGASGHRFYVLQGASYQDEFAYDRELRDLAQERSDLLTYVDTVSRPAEEHNAGWSGETGRVNNLVEKYIDEFNLDPASTLVYACGHPGMIEDVKERLTPKGWKVKEERFWKE